MKRSDTKALNEQADEMCKRLGLSELLADYERSKDSDDGTVGERGAKLSGGERQRVGIIRVLLRDPTVLVLDEATSALDNTTEKTVQALFAEGRNRRCEVLIAHRLSTIESATEIVVLQGGRIVERGSHSELLQIDRGMYAKLSQTQKGGV